MKTTPEIVTNSNPTGLDALIEKFQSAISGVQLNIDTQPVNYFELIFGNIARKDEETGEPIGYWQGKDYYPLKPDDNVRAKAFFYIDDPSGSLSLGNSFQYNINLVVYYNQDLFKHNIPPIKEYFIEAVLNEIRTMLEIQDKSSIRVFRESENVFSKYELSEKTMFKFPMDGFRISFTSSATLNCGELLSI